MPKDQTNKIKLFRPFLIVVGIAAFIYYLTACRSVGYIDSGELAVNCYVLGIPHPTGYPLYVNLGRLAVMFLPGSVIFRCNLLSLLLTSFAAGALFMVMMALPVKLKSSFIKSTSAAAVALFAAFSGVWWAQGISNEVYCLTILLSTLAIFYFSRYNQAKENRFLLIGFFLWGLSFTVHLSSIFLAVAILYLIISADGWRGIIKPKYIWSVGFFLIALSFYLYIPVRASHTPFLNWSNPQSWQGFINHLTGWQYRVWMFNSLEQMFGGIKYFGRLIYGQFGGAGLILIIVGMIRMFRAEKRLAFFFALIILADVIYSSNYEIYDIESYYLPAIMCLAVFAFWGVAEIYCWFEKKTLKMTSSPKIKVIAISVLILLPLSNLVRNYAQSDYSRWRLAEAGAENILQSMGPNGIAFIENWDFYSPWLYMRFIENRRPDAILIDKELMKRSWYLDFLQRHYPEILSKSQSQISEFKKALVPFESGGQYDSRLLTLTYEAMIQSIIENNIENRPFYANFEAAQFYNFKQYKIPTGGLYRLQNNPDYVSFDISKIDISAWETARGLLDDRARVALDYFYRIVKKRAGYCYQAGYIDEANDCRRLAIQMEPLLKGIEK